MYKTKNVLCRYLVAKSQKEKKKDKVIMNQLMKAIAADASNLLQWFGPHCFKSLSMSTVIPAAAQAAAKVIVEVTCFKNKKLLEKEAAGNILRQSRTFCGGEFPIWIRELIVLLVPQITTKSMSWEGPQRLKQNWLSDLTGTIHVNRYWKYKNTFWY